MRIKLNVLADGTCALIYADAEEHDESWLVNTHPIRAVRIWHNDTCDSLQIAFNPLKNYDNDYVVTFKSKVPFNQFCEDFATSEYNEASNYRYLSHNCAYAANYALKTAGIDLPINWIRLTSLLPSPAWRIPSTILTPYDLFVIGKNYKIQSLETSDTPLSNISSQIEGASSNLLTWATLETNALKKPYVEKMVYALKNIRITRRHHDELYLDALIKTNDLLTHKTTAKEKNEYKRLIQFFKERVPSKADQVADQFTNRVTLCFLLTLAAGIIDYNTDNLRLTLPVIILSIIACGQMLIGNDAEEEALFVEDESYKVIDTPLSAAMFNLLQMTENPPALDIM